MRGVARGDVLRALVAEARRVDACEEMLAAAEEHGRDREVDLVDQPSGEVLANGGDATAKSDVLALSRLGRASQRSMASVGNEVERRSALHRDGGASMVRQHEDGYVVGRVVAPPSFPTVVGPGTPQRPEHIAAEDPGADVLETARGEVVANHVRHELSGALPVTTAGAHEDLEPDRGLVDRHHSVPAPWIVEEIGRAHV